MSVFYVNFYDEIVDTPRGRKTLAELKDADALYEDAQRIKRAVKEGLLPRVTADQAEAIAKDVEHRGDMAAAKLDQAEGWGW